MMILSEKNQRIDTKCKLIGWRDNKTVAVYSTPSGGLVITHKNSEGRAYKVEVDYKDMGGVSREMGL